MTRPNRPSRASAGERSSRTARTSRAPRTASPGPAANAAPRPAPGTSRARALARRRSSPVSTFGALGVVAAVLLAGLGYGFSTRDQNVAAITHTSSRNLPVGSATAVCQGQIGAGSDTSTTLTAFSPGGTAATGTGAAAAGGTPAADGATVQYVDGKAFDPLKIGAVGTRSTAQQVAQFTSVTDDAGLPRTVPLVIQASGSYAPGFSAAELLRSDTGGKRGLAGSPCTTPGTDFWFAGVSIGTTDRDSYLEIANTDSAPASVNLTFFGADGQIDTGTVGHDITVLPKTSMQYLLSTVMGLNAPKTGVASVHVTTTQGRIAAQVLDTDRNLTGGKDGRGFDFIPAQGPNLAQQPTQTIPGIPAPGQTLSKFELVLTATSTQPVSIDHMYWYGKSGRFEISGQTADPAQGYTKRDAPLSLTPGHTVVLDMKDAARDPDEAATLQLVGSGGPFVAGVRLVENDSKSNTQDTAYLSPTTAVGGLAVVPDSNIGGAAKTALLLTAAGDKGATVQVTTVGQDNKPVSDTVQIGANSTVAYVPKATGWFTTVVQPQAGGDPVYGARVLTDLPAKGGMQATVQELAEARVLVAVPPVAGDLSGAVVR
ncbi:hypothetical protein GCM10009839_75930 [Catenulispora yoronensis]|uniref:Uncharacterized protein n=1 Tax=Catenulispora yoronensis TaxID=450799 RepID=A0ABP5GVY5_9ACTN